MSKWPTRRSRWMHCLSTPAPTRVPQAKKLRCDGVLQRVSCSCLLPPCTLSLDGWGRLSGGGRFRGEAVLRGVGGDEARGVLVGVGTHSGSRFGVEGDFVLPDSFDHRRGIIGDERPTHAHGDRRVVVG